MILEVGKASFWQKYTTEDGLLSNLVYSAVIDKNGNLWFGCKNPDGASMFNGRRWQNFTTQNCEIGRGHIWDIKVDEQNNLWFATAGGGLSKFDGLKWTTFTRADGLAGNYVYAVEISLQGVLCCGCAPQPDVITQEGGVSYLKKNEQDFVNYSSDYTQGQYVGKGNSGLCDNRVYSIVFDNKDRAWFGTKGGGICRFDGKDWKTFNKSNGLPVNEVGDGAAAVDKEGNVWFGTRGGGACRFTEHKLDIFSMTEGLAGNFVYAIKNNPDGTLWFGCSPDPQKVNREGGISIFDGSTFINYTSDFAGGKCVGLGNSLLADNRVYAIVFDEEGNGWFGTKGGGVSRLSFEAIVK